MKLDGIQNSVIDHFINEYVHNERNRKILHRRFVDGITLERLAEEFGLSVARIKKIIHNDGDRVLNILYDIFINR